MPEGPKAWPSAAPAGPDGEQDSVSAQLTLAGEVLGTPACMAPERAPGR